MATFSASDFFHPGQNGKVFQHRPIDFIHSNAMNPFSKLIYGEKVMHSRYKLLILFAKSCASPWQLFSVIFIPSGSERNNFPHRPIHFVHTNGMNPFSKLINGEKVMKSRSIRLRTEIFLNWTLRFYRTKRQVREAMAKHITQMQTGHFQVVVFFASFTSSSSIFNYEKSWKFWYFEVINSLATSMCSKIWRQLYIAGFACAHQVRKYAFWMKQNVFILSHFLI